MKSVTVLEWTMGWAWPVMVVLAALIFTGIQRIVNWDAHWRSQDTMPAGIPREDMCVCDQQ